MIFLLGFLYFSSKLDDSKESDTEIIFSFEMIFLFDLHFFLFIGINLAVIIFFYIIDCLIRNFLIYFFKLLKFFSGSQVLYSIE